MTPKRYLIRRTPARKPITVTARREVAEYYGWNRHFEEFVPGEWTQEGTGIRYLTSPCLAVSKKRPGKLVQISIDPSKSGTVAGKASKFRISTGSTLFDLAQVAVATDVEWYWMTTFSGERRSREKWLAIHDAVTQ